MPDGQDSNIGDSKFPDVPEIPKEIIDAQNSGKLVVFIGAGLSALFGLPNWKKMALEILEKMHKDQRLITYSGKKQLEGEADDPRKLLSIICGLCNNEEYFKNLIKETLNKEQTPDNKLEVMINVLNRWNAPIVTTNYDTILENRMENRDVYSSCKEIESDQAFKNTYILHLHGSVKEPETMIVTVPEYHKLYHDRRDEYHAQGVLDSLFHENTVLFIGYGLSDYEVLEYTQKHIDSHYALMPYTRMDEPIIAPLKTYYKSVGVEILPYFIDNDGYSTIVDVIKEWDAKLQSLSTLPTDIHERIDLIISSEPNNQLVRTLLIQLNDDDEIIVYLFRNIEKTSFKHEWIKILCEKKYDSEWMIKKIREGNEFVSRLLLINLYSILQEEHDEELKKITIEFINLFTKDINPINVKYLYIHDYCAKFIVMFMDCFDATIMDYIEKITSFDVYSPLIIDAICNDPDHFLKLNNESKILLLKHAIYHSISNTHRVDEYYINKLFDTIDGKLEPHIWNRLFTTISEVMVEYAKEHQWSGLRIGSVDDYLNDTGYHDEEYYLVKWFCLSIYGLSYHDLEVFVKNHLNDESHLLNTLSLHVININFDNLQSIFWEIDDYTFLNYSELYDLVKRNAELFSPSKLDHFIDVVVRSFENEDYTIQYSNACRFDLLALLPFITDESNKYLKKYRYEKDAGILKPADRGKLFITSSWINEFGDPDKFKNIDEVIVKAKEPSISLVDKQSIKKYFESSVGELITKPDLLDDIPNDYLDIICSSLERSDDDLESIFKLFIKINDRIVDTNIHHILNSVGCMRRWADEVNYSEKVRDYLLSILKKNVKYYCEETIQCNNDLFVESYNNWFSGILWILLNDMKYNIIQPIMPDLLDIIDAVNKDGESNNRLLVDVVVAVRWDFVKYCDSNWTKKNYSKILFHNDIIPASTYLVFSSKFDEEIFNGLIENRLIEKILNEPSRSNEFGNAPISIGAITTYAYYKDKNKKYLELLKTGLTSTNNAKLIKGVLIELGSKDGIDNGTSSGILKLLIGNIPSNINPHPFLAELSQYFDSDKGDFQIKLDFMKKVSTLEVTLMPETMTNVLIKLSKTHEEIVDITYNLATSMNYYNDSFKKLVRSLIESGYNTAGVIKICNFINSRCNYEFDEDIKKLKEKLKKES